MTEKKSDFTATLDHKENQLTKSDHEKHSDSIQSSSFEEASDERSSFNENYDPNLEWTEEEEARVRRKIDIKLLPLILVMSFVLNMDRTNLSNAISDDLAGDLGFTNDGVNNGILIYAIMFTIFTLPANTIAKRIGPNVWIPLLMNIWGVLTWCHVFLSNFGGYVALRTTIAIAEAGFIPGCLLYLTGWYKSNELATRLASFWAVQSFASAVSGLISFGVFRLRGHSGLEGWKWLFLIDGVLTHVVAVFAMAWLPLHPGTTASIFRGRKGWFTEREVKIAITRLIRDDLTKTEQHQPMTLNDVKLAILDINVWAHLLLAFIYFMVLTPIGTYLPSMIASSGFENTMANLLTMPSYIINLIFSLLIAISSDKYGHVGLHMMIGIIWMLAGFFALRFLPVGAGRWQLYAAATVTASTPSLHGMNIAWMSSNVAPPGKRSFALGAIIGAANICAVPGAKIYAVSDAPRYFKGNTACIAVTVVMLLVLLALRFRYIYTNKWRQNKWNSMTEEERQHYNETTKDVGSDRLDYQFRV